MRPFGVLRQGGEEDVEGYIVDFELFPWSTVVCECFLACFWTGASCRFSLEARRLPALLRWVHHNWHSIGAASVQSLVHLSSCWLPALVASPCAGCTLKVRLRIEAFVHLVVCRRVNMISELRSGAPIVCELQGPGGVKVTHGFQRSRLLCS